MAHHHNFYTKLTAKWLIEQNSIDLIGTEIGFNDSIFDVIGISTQPRSVPKISIVEVKVQRPDLLQDLRKRKMLKYEKYASHCYLAATKEAFAFTDLDSLLLDLEGRGLPNHWGILLLPNSSSSGVTCLRKARALKKPNELFIQKLIILIARSYMYKTLLKD